MQVQSLASLSGSRSSAAVSCGVGRRHGWDLALLWMWCRPVATVPIQPLSWESPYAMGEGLKGPKKTKQNKNKKQTKKHIHIDLMMFGATYL